jgi:SAM-dependent methyltransferase
MHSDTDLNYIDFFQSLINEGQHEYEKVGWRSFESMYAKFCVLFHIIDWNEIQNVCDVGCGTGAFEDLFSKYKPNVKFIGIDPIQEYLEISKSKNVNNAVFFKGDINNLPFDNDQFDLVVNLGVLQNFNGDINHAINELCRITKNYLYIVTLDSEFTGYKNGERKKDPINIYYNPDSLKKMVRGCECKIVGCQSISVDTVENMTISKNFIKPLHNTNTFFILAEKNTANHENRNSST